MPNTCETNVPGSLPENTFRSSFLSRRNFIRYTAATVIGVSLASTVFPNIAFAATSAEKQAEADEVKQRMDDWEVLLAQFSNDYYDAMDAHDEAVRKMQEAQARIDAAIERQNELQDELGHRARTMYKQGPLSFLDVIFGSSSFVEFSTSWDLLNAINNRDADLIRECEETRIEAEEARDEYSRQEQIAAQKLAEAEEIYENAQEIMRAYEVELANLNEEIARLIEEERKAEEERIRREEEERARQQALSGGGGGSGSGAASGYVPYDGQTYSSIVDYALSRLGCPYVWAASGPDAFDCSGLTSWSYSKVGIYIPRGGNAQYYNAPMRLAVSDALPGDILWNTSHVGLCIGGGQFVHAPRPGDVVKISNIAGYGWLGAARWWY